MRTDFSNPFTDKRCCRGLSIAHAQANRAMGRRRACADPKPKLGRQRH